MPWKGTKETKQKLGTSRAHLVYMIQVHQPDYKQVRKHLQIAKCKKIWRKHWGKSAFTLEQPEAESPPGEKTRYIQMVQAYGSVQLSMGAAQIGGVVAINTLFSLCLTLNAENRPREPTIALVKEVFSMMEVKKMKVWICLSENANSSFTGYFSSMVAKIKDYVQNFITCPATQVFWWLRCQGCLTEDVNRMIGYCFTLEQQKCVIQSRYLSNKGYAVVTEGDSDDIINATSSNAINNMSLGLTDREHRELVASKAYDARAILFGEAKEGAMEAYHFSSSASITTIHSTKRADKSVATTKTLAQSLFSIETGTSMGTDNKDDNGISDTESVKIKDHNRKGSIAIKGMEIMDRETEQEDGKTGLDSATKAAKSSALSLAMRNATDNLKLSSDKVDKHINLFMDDKEGDAKH
jgi:hypothetical protein